MTIPLILLAIPSVFLGHVPRACRSGAELGSTSGWRPIFEEGEEILRPRAAEAASSSSASTAC